MWSYIAEIVLVIAAVIGIVLALRSLLKDTPPTRRFW